MDFVFIFTRLAFPSNFILIKFIVSEVFYVSSFCSDADSKISKGEQPALTYDKNCSMGGNTALNSILYSVILEGGEEAEKRCRWVGLMRNWNSITARSHARIVVV